MKTTIKFTYESEYTSEFAGHCGTPRKLEVVLGGDITLDELVEQFGLFVKGVGYYPPDNAHLDYVDNDTEKPKSLEE